MNVSFALCFPVSKSACFTKKLTQDLLGFFLSLRFLNENNDALQLSKERNSELVTNTVVKLCMASRSRIGDILILEEDLGKSKSYPKCSTLQRLGQRSPFKGIHRGDSQRRLTRKGNKFSTSCLPFQIQVRVNRGLNFVSRSEF